MNDDVDIGHHDLTLLKQVCEQIIKDHTVSKDWTAIDELFKHTPSEHLKGFLSEL